jgi:NitT/TauT family transport system ATP-binding protein
MKPHNLIYKIENVTKTFTSDTKKVTALSNVSFDIKEGELVVVVGPSGCGKTTLLKILADLLKPTKGRVTFSNSENSNKIGFVFQESSLMPWRTVIDNVILPLEIKGNEEKSEMYKEAKKLIRLLSLDRFEKYYPSELSGGMGQRTAIARALVPDPEVLLMDEPFGALDELLRQRLNFELLDLKRKTNKTIVFVTHNIVEAVILADKIVVMGLNPNRVKGSLSINLPKRTPEMLTSPIFLRYVERVRRLINLK